MGVEFKEPSAYFPGGWPTWHIVQPGTDACTIYGDSYVFIMPGNTMGFAINSGRIAGERSADYVKNL